MPTENLSKPPKVSVHWVPGFIADLNGVYEDVGGGAADEIRAALIAAINKLKRYEWDETLIKQYGIVGDAFSFDFCRDYKFTFKVVTDRDERKHPIEEHYFLKRLLRKK